MVVDVINIILRDLKSTMFSIMSQYFLNAFIATNWRRATRARALKIKFIINKLFVSLQG